MSRCLLLVVLACLTLVSSAVIEPRHRDGSIDEEAIRDTSAPCAVERILTKYDYPFEAHIVYTADGYILTVHRIPYSPKNKSRGKKPIAFLQHGLLSSSADYVVMGPDTSIAFLLADLGYDVWMGNTRGNTFSKNHSFIDPSKNAFWEFSWHEMGIYDLPAMIDYALAHTGEKDLHYIGHSQGTTSFFVMCSQRPDYNAKIRTMQALAPIAFMSNMYSPVVQLLAKNVNSFEWIAKSFGLYEFLPSSDFITLLEDIVCKEHSMTQAVCSNILFLIGGYNPKEMNLTALPGIFENIPAGASVNQVVHYAQEVNSGKFRQFDHGLLKNFEKYGSFTPPDYKLELITCPVFLHISESDWLSAVKDVNELARKLGNNMGAYLVPDYDFSHLDYVYGIDARKLYQNKLVSLMSRYD